MKFCLFSTQKHWGGGETLIWTLADELQSNGHEVAWVARHNSEVAEYINRHGGHLLHKTRSRYGSPSDWIGLSRQLRDWRPEAILLNDTHSVMLEAAVHWRLPTPRPCRLAYKHTIFPLRSKLKYQWFCDRLVCVSHAARDTVVAGGLSPDHVAVIHGGCPPPDVSPGAAERIRQELKLTHDQKLLVCIGNLLECKGHADLITALASMPGDPQFRLVIAGQGEEKERLQRLVQQLGLTESVQLLGYRNDPNDLLAAADLVIHPSHAEGLSLVLIQAQLLAKPIVATPVGGAVEVLSAAGPPRPGTWLARPKDPGNLAKAISQALLELSTPAPELGEQLSATAIDTQQRFSITRSAQKLVELASSLR